MKKTVIFENLAERIEKVAVDTAKNTIGKSVPLWSYEVEKPAELKNIDMKNIEVK